MRRGGTAGGLPERLVEFSRFVLIGGATAAVYFTAFWLCHALAGLGSILSVSLSYVASTCFQFFANQLFTFRVPFAPRSVVRYAALLVLNYGLTVAIVHICETRLDLSPYVGVVLAVAATVAVSFHLSRRWVYGGR